jgi:hypothetical protein
MSFVVAAQSYKSGWQISVRLPENIAAYKAKTLDLVVIFTREKPTMGILSIKRKHDETENLTYNGILRTGCSYLILRMLSRYPELHYTWNVSPTF